MKMKTSSANILTEKGSDFLLNGEKITLISGAVHYFRVVPEYWRDRLTKLKNAGFNTVETYVPWNLHEPREGEFHFQGLADVEGFLSLCAELGLNVIFRASPYICAEWDFGGLPWWLLKYRNMRLRCADPLFLEKVRNYFKALMPRIVPFLGINGGPIIAMQVENEYGSYGNDTAYLRAVKRIMTDCGAETYWITSDGPTDLMLSGGMACDDTLATINYGSRTEESFRLFAQHQQNRPEMVTEFWIGWFDHWRNEHHRREWPAVADELRLILDRGANVNFYMFHGGTNFGLYNGANFNEGIYLPTVTSYDYDALLTEDGRETEKLRQVSAIIGERFGKTEQTLLETIETAAYGRIEFTEQLALKAAFGAFPPAVESAAPLTMEELDVDYGFVQYETVLRGPHPEGELIIEKLRDRALVRLNGTFVGIKERNDAAPLKLELPGETNRLEILVENMGRINYGELLGERKGIDGYVRFNYQMQFGWKQQPLPLSTFPDLPYGTQAFRGSGFHKAVFDVKTPADTFLKVHGFGKGVAAINGFNLGRFWDAGPQRTLYLPAPLLKPGRNILEVFAIEGENGWAELVDAPQLG